MQIKAKITGIEYQPKLTSKLAKFDLQDIDINDLPASCLITDKNFTFGLSKWVSPKRTRSYPYERVYNTLGSSKRITVIPVIKDEGLKGERDYIQWDTVSLMSLLDVFVIFGYYQNAEKHPARENKITNQKFDNQLIIDKIKEIKNYHSSALHWNLKEIRETFPALIEKAKTSYQNLGNRLNVKFHSAEGIDKFAKQFVSGINDFIATSRQKARAAQSLEKQTVQPKEALSTLTKATITIENYLGGKYYFTTDEIKTDKDTLYLIEGKHSRRGILPGIDSIKDGLLKMILYSNLKEVSIENKAYQAVPVLKLTSTKLSGKINSGSTKDEILSFYAKNKLNKRQTGMLNNLFAEAEINNFLLTIEKAE